MCPRACSALFSMEAKFPAKLVSLCVFVVIINQVSSMPQVPVDDRQNATQDERCPKRAVFTLISGGRTGNQIWEYVSTVVFAKYLPHQQLPYSNRETLDKIVKIFQNTTDIMLPAVEDIPSDCPCMTNETFTNWTDPNSPMVSLYTPYDTEQLIEIYRNYTNNIIVNMYAIYVDPVIKNIDFIKKVFHYLPEHVDYCNGKFNEIKSTYLEKHPGVDNITFVGVHVRRTDYLPYIKVNDRDETSVEYIQAATQFYRDNKSVFGTPLFVVISDEKDWVQERFSGDDVFVAGNGDIENPTSDLALLSLCNNTIIDYGTFGWWGSVYANGHVVTVRYRGDQVDKIMRNNTKWHFVNTNKRPIVVA